MGIFKDIVKKVALAAAVVAGKRILSKVDTYVIDGDKTTTEPVAPASASKPKSTTSSRRKPATVLAQNARSKSGEIMNKFTRKPKTASSAASGSKIDAKLSSTRKPRTNAGTNSTAAKSAKKSVSSNTTATNKAPQDESKSEAS